MSFRHLDADPRSERLLFVRLEEPSYGLSEYRHVRATVVRRAVPHAYANEADALVNKAQTWGDDKPSKCFGYRCASWQPVKSGGIYVDDMQLRGQIDLCHNPMHEGRPYGNEVSFSPHSVDANTAHAMSSTFTKWQNFCDRHNIRNRGDSFYIALNHLAQFLKITTTLWFMPGHEGCSFEKQQNFEELDIAFAEERLNILLAPFYQKAN